MSLAWQITKLMFIHDDHINNIMIGNIFIQWLNFGFPRFLWNRLTGDLPYFKPLNLILHHFC